MALRSCLNTTFHYLTSLSHIYGTLMSGRVVSVDHHCGCKEACSHLVDEDTAIQGDHVTCLRWQGQWLNSRLRPFFTWWQGAKWGIQKSACVPKEHFPPGPYCQMGATCISPLSRCPLPWDGP